MRLPRKVDQSTVISSRAEGMRISLTKSRVPVSRIIRWIGVRLVIGTAARSAFYTLAIAGRQGGAQVDGEANTAEIPRSALPTVLPKVPIAVFGDNHTRGDSAVGTHQS